ncbi:hypothetical protein [Dawidia soli]|uniref:Uncharacterized protein n=1 Tax=Dawidia soli TaxID=2782352 RepID=A0AAP2GF65_9BACT|nr:hypothetical protein [Dawidia soli]MBT1689167.1 hypothetical protein [Dawidia soli]
MEDFDNATPAPLLTPLIVLVHKYIQRSPATAGSGGGLREVRDTFHREAERVKRALMRLRIKRTDECRYQVRVAQQDLMELIDLVVAEGGAAEIEASPGYTRSVVGLLFKGLEGLLAYIEHGYPGQFDHEIPLCDGQREIWQLRIHRQLSVISPWFREQGLSGSLWDIVSEPFCEILAPAGLPLVSHREWKYLSKLLTELEQLAKNEVTDAEEALLCLLVHHNFNKDQYLEYCTHYIAAQVSDNEPTNEEQLARVLRYRNLIDAVYPTAAHVGLWPGHDALHTRLMRWMDRIQAYYQGAVENPGEFGEQDVSTRRKGPAGWQRVRTTASLKELAGFFRLLLECGFFRETVFATISRFIAFGFSTGSSTEPVFGNVRKAFSDPSDVALRFAEELCKKMLQLIAEIRSGKKILKDSKKRS